MESVTSATVRHVRLEDMASDKPSSNLAEYDGRLAAAVDAMQHAGLWKGLVESGGSSADILAQAESSMHQVSSHKSLHTVGCELYVRIVREVRAPRTLYKGAASTCWLKDVGSCWGWRGDLHCCGIGVVFSEWRTTCSA